MTQRRLKANLTFAKITLDLLKSMKKTTGISYSRILEACFWNVQNNRKGELK